MDSALLQAAKQGDQSAFADLIQPLELPLYHLALSLVTNQHDAEDVWQEAVIKAWLNIRRLRAETDLRPWLCRIVINESHNIQRQRRKQPVLLEQYPPQEVQIQPVEQCLVVHDYLRQLPLEQRMALVLRFWLDLSIQDIASLTKVPLSTAKSRLYHGMQRVKQLAEEEAQGCAVN